MQELDEDALICDFAETYHILDYKGLPVSLAATLASGLREDSRIKLRMAGMPVSRQMQILALIADEARWLHWAKTEDGHKNRNYPDSIHDKLMEKKEQPHGYQTAQDYEAARRRIIQGT